MKKMKYVYEKKVYNHDSLPLKLGKEYTIEKDARFKNSYKIVNYGLIINDYTLKECFKEVK